MSHQLAGNGIQATGKRVVFAGSHRCSVANTNGEQREQTHKEIDSSLRRIFFLFFS